MTAFFKRFLAAIQVPKHLDEVLSDYRRIGLEMDIMEQAMKGDPVPEGTERTVFTMEDK